jgi:orotate phosphoribosyltransferase
VTDGEALRRLLLERSVRRGDFLLSSGQRSSYYIDCRLTTMSAEGMVLIGRMGWEAIRRMGWRPRAVGGLTMGADPVAYAIAAASRGTELEVDGFSVRKEAKGHGAGKLIEGNFRAGDPVVVIEDVITTGGSADKAVKAVRAARGEVLGVLAVVDREEGGREALEGQGVKVVALTTAAALGLKSSGQSQPPDA